MLTIFDHYTTHASSLQAAQKKKKNRPSFPAHTHPKFHKECVLMPTQDGRAARFGPRRRLHKGHRTMHLDRQRRTSCMRTHTITAQCACTRETEPHVVVRIRGRVRVDIGDGQVRAVIVPAATANRALDAPTTSHCSTSTHIHATPKNTSTLHTKIGCNHIFHVRKEGAPPQCNALK
jgi:hypothetical protein